MPGVWPESDAPAFLLLVNQNAGALTGNHRERHFELLAAIASQRAEDVSRQTLRVNANQRRAGLYVAHDQRDGLFRFGARRRAQSESVNQKMAPARGEIGGGNLLYFGRTHPWNYIGLN